jgi:hypothetical protein
MDGKVRENVLLRYDFDLIKYALVIRAGGLDVDLAQLCKGNVTIVGNGGYSFPVGRLVMLLYLKSFDLIQAHNVRPLCHSQPPPSTLYIVREDCVGLSILL